MLAKYGPPRDLFSQCLSCKTVRATNVQKFLQFCISLAVKIACHFCPWHETKLHVSCYYVKYWYFCCSLHLLCCFLRVACREGLGDGFLMLVQCASISQGFFLQPLWDYTDRCVQFRSKIFSSSSLFCPNVSPVYCKSAQTLSQKCLASFLQHPEETWHPQATVTGDMIKFITFWCQISSGCCLPKII